MIHNTIRSAISSLSIFGVRILAVMIYNLVKDFGHAGLNITQLCAFFYCSSHRWPEICNGFLVSFKNQRRKSLTSRRFTAKASILWLTTEPLPKKIHNCFEHSYVCALLCNHMKSNLLYQILSLLKITHEQMTDYFKFKNR